LGDKKGRYPEREVCFEPVYSNGLKTQRDAYCYNFSSQAVKENIKRMIDFYNEQLIGRKSGAAIDMDEKKISWSRGLLQQFNKGKKIEFHEDSLRKGIYRPFEKQFLYFNKELNEMMYQMPKIFPTAEAVNLCITVPGIGSKSDFMPLMVDNIPDLGFNGACQCFPLYYCTFNTLTGSLEQHDGITDYIHKLANERYAPERVGKEDIFFYIYGALHSKSYRERFASDLKKELPHIPLVDDYNDFKAFSKAGEALSTLHTRYEELDYTPGLQQLGVKTAGFEAVEVEAGFERECDYFAVEKLRFGKGIGGKVDKSIIHYNPRLTITGIPLKAYEYKINGRSAIEWIIDRYQISVDKESGITNNPNDYAKEVNRPRYILSLLLSVIALSAKTVDIIETLPKLKI
jgi:predicted helicase